MLAYSGKGQCVIENIRLGDLIGEMVSLLKASISKKAILNLNLKEPLPPLRGDPSQIRQVIMNLVINASEALGEHSGAITISTGVMECSREYLSEAFWTKGWPKGSYVWLEVSDTGCGMEPETQRRIFEPFLPPNSPGAAWACRPCWASCAGIEARSRFTANRAAARPSRCCSPPCWRKRRWRAEARERSAAGWKGAGTILLVDDEESVRIMGIRMLERVGFEVLAAMDGREALEIYRERHEEIALVLLD
jgi:hypothetical protein